MPRAEPFEDAMRGFIDEALKSGAVVEDVSPSWAGLRTRTRDLSLELTAVEAQPAPRRAPLRLLFMMSLLATSVFMTNEELARNLEVTTDAFFGAVELTIEMIASLR